jgi:hypothetical protein
MRNAYIASLTLISGGFVVAVFGLNHIGLCAGVSTGIIVGSMANTLMRDER